MCCVHVVRLVSQPLAIVLNNNTIITLCGGCSSTFCVVSERIQVFRTVRRLVSYLQDESENDYGVLMANSNSTGHS